MAPAPDPRDDWHVICLCAAWCGVCRDWLPVMRELAQSRPDLRLAWIDVEDEDEAMGEVEIQTFPTVLVAHGGEPRFFGPVAPSAPQLARLVNGLQAQADPPSTALSPEIRALLGRLAPLLPGAAM